MLALVGISSPAFLTALIGLYLFSVRLRVDALGRHADPGRPFSVGDLLHHLILPAAMLIGHAALIMRYMRASLLEVLNQDYVRTARAKGVKESWVVVKHALRNALLPVVTLIGSTVGLAVGGAIFIESVFNWPGMGLLLVGAVETGLPHHHGRDARHWRLRDPREHPHGHRLRRHRSPHQDRLT